MHKTNTSINGVYDDFKEDLKTIDALIQTAVCFKDQHIEEIANYIILAGGKRLRPLLAMVVAKLLNYKGQGHYSIAAAVELIHTATLLHDDVVDNSQVRRGVLSAHEKWGNKYAILVGDFLFTQSFRLMLQAESMDALNILSLSSSIIAEGEVKQLGYINKIDILEAEYIDVIGSKTAELFGAICKSIASLANKSQEMQMYMYLLGINLGIAFQIIDDVLDYTSKETGKTLGNDYVEGKITLPVIIAYSRASEVDKLRIENLIKNDEKTDVGLCALIEILNSYDAFEWAKKRAHEYLEKANQILAAVAVDGSSGLTALNCIIEYQCERVA